jgi:hypothetical protein
MKTLLYISTLLFLVSCGSKQKSRKEIKLKVAVNSTLRKYLDYPSIPYKLDDSVYYDSLNNQTISVFDSLTNRKTPITIFSILTDDFCKTIYLQSDTTVLFDTTKFSNFTIGDPKDFLSLTTPNFDTIYIGQKVVGCFGGYTEKTVLLKSDKGVKINYKRNNTPDLDLETVIPDSIFNRIFNSFVIKAKKIFPDKAGGLTFLHMSTTSIDTYIRKGNTIYVLPDLYDWKGYDEFKKSIGIRVDG